MKQFKKLIATVITFAMVLGMVGVMPTMTAKAEVTPFGTVAFDPDTNDMTITVTQNDAYTADFVDYVSIAEMKENKTSKEYEVKGAYSTYEVPFVVERGSDGTTLTNKATATINLATFAKKGIALKVHMGDEATAVACIVTKNENKLKIALDFTKAGAKKFTVTNGSAALDASAVIKFKVEGGEWLTFDDANVNAALAEVEQYGTTLYFKEVGTSAIFASAEGKVKLPKLGKAPTVTVDYTKDQVKFPKGVEVMGIYHTGTTVANTWESLAAVSSKADVVDFTKLQATEVIATAFSFKVRTAVAAAKKPASAITTVNVYAPTDAPTVGEKDKGVNVTLNTNAKSEVTGIKISNTTDKVIEYTIVASGTPGATAVWTKVNAAKTAPGVKVVADAAIAGKIIFVRTAGAKETKTVKGIRATAADGYVSYTIPGESSSGGDTPTPTPDTTAPVLSAGGVSELETGSGTTATLTFTTDEAGTYYYALVKSTNKVGEATPITADILKAQDDAMLVNKGTASATVGANTISLTGLTPGSQRTAYIIVVDEAGNVSAMLEIVDVNPTAL